MSYTLDEQRVEKLKSLTERNNIVWERVDCHTFYIEKEMFVCGHIVITDGKFVRGSKIICDVDKELLCEIRKNSERREIDWLTYNIDQL